MLGDRVQDAETALRLGGRGLVVTPAEGAEAVRARALDLTVVPDLMAAARHIGAAAA